MKYHAFLLLITTALTANGVSPYSCTVTAVSSVICTHNLTTTTPWVACYDGDGHMLGGSSANTKVTDVVANTVNQATVTFSGVTTGQCSISTGSMGPKGDAGINSSGGDVSTTGTNTYSAIAVNDARAAAHTLPAKTGILEDIPPTCTLGEIYFSTNATAGRNAYYCTATNTWTQQAGVSSGKLRQSLNGSGALVGNSIYNGPILINGFMYPAIATPTGVTGTAITADGISRVGAVQWAAAGSRKYVSYSFFLPANWDGSAVRFDLLWWIATGSTAAQNQVWGTETFCAGTGTVSTSATYGSSSTVSKAITSTSTNTMYTAQLTIPTSGCTPGKTLFGRLWRSETDTAATTLRLLQARASAVGFLE